MRRLTLGCLVSVSLLVALLAVGSAQGNKSGEKWVAPAQAKIVENPYLVTAVTVQKGKVLFTQQCTPCHGASGKGDGPAGKFLGKPLPDFSNAEFHEQSDGELFWKLSEGKAPMPAFEEILSEEQRWLLVGYLRTFLATKQQGGSK